MGISSGQLGYLWRAPARMETQHQTRARKTIG
jgi:hypothetical protein